MVIILACGCKTQPDKYTSALSDYLSRNHKTEIPKKESVFVVLPKNTGCSSCKKATIDYLNKNSNNDTYLICSENELEYLNGEIKCGILVDTFGEIESYNLESQNVALIKTLNNKVLDVISTQPENVRQLLAENIH